MPTYNDLKDAGLDISIPYRLGINEILPERVIHSFNTITLKELCNSSYLLKAYIEYSIRTNNHIKLPLLRGSFYGLTSSEAAVIDALLDTIFSDSMFPRNNDEVGYRRWHYMLGDFPTDIVEYIKNHKRNSTKWMFCLVNFIHPSSRGFNDILSSVAEDEKFAPLFSLFQEDTQLDLVDAILNNKDQCGPAMIKAAKRCKLLNRHACE